MRMFKDIANIFIENTLHHVLPIKQNALTLPLLSHAQHY